MFVESVASKNRRMFAKKPTPAKTTLTRKTIIALHKTKDHLILFF